MNDFTVKDGNKIADYPLLVLTTPPESMGYTSPGGGGGRFRTEARTRGLHAQALQATLAHAWEAAEEREAAAHGTRTGVYLEFAGAPGCDLRTMSLEDRRAGIRLLNIRNVQDGDQVVTLATVYIPKAKSAYFLEKIEAYESEETAKGKPKNEPLVASIEDIRVALVSAFWTDDPELVPGAQPKWIEVWLSDNTVEGLATFRERIADLEVEEHPMHPAIVFPERCVLLLKANLQGLTGLIDLSDQLAELRSAREPSSFFIELENAEQVEWVTELLERTTYTGNDVSVCILDCGVNSGHPLINPMLAAADLHAVDLSWGTNDHGKHGTLMAGVSGYGDLQRALEQQTPVTIGHVLESVKILPPPPDENPQHLWGHVTAQGMAKAEIQAPARRRVYCMAVTATDTRDRGKPTSWSGELDQLAAGVSDGTRRLVIVSAGNIDDPVEWANYPDSNVTNEVHDPGQSWNAVTVGAFTERVQIQNPHFVAYTPIAAAGSLSPFSTTSRTWPANKWPIKPDIVFEGGNVALAPDGHAWDLDELQLISTYHDPTIAHFGRFGATSAATAMASHFAATVWSGYPDLWPETVRGLMVHSAEWTEAMKETFLDGEGKTALQCLLRSCGYGLPSLERATRCLTNRLTLVSQATLQPYKKKTDGGYATNDLHFYELPWPVEVLQELGATEVRMRVTLSYFIEPGPGEVGWKERYRYASHALRFEVNAPTESQDEFLARINMQAREEDEGHPGTAAPSDHWLIGQQRDVGSIHSDEWRGTAAELSTSNLIAVRPAVGWWRERHHLGRWNAVTRYSLVVSIHSPVEELDIYTPVANMVEVPVAVEIFAE